MRDNLFRQKVLELYDKISIGTSLTIESLNVETYTIRIATWSDQMLSSVKAHNRDELQILYHEAFSNLPEFYTEDPEYDFDFQTFEKNFVKLYYFKWVDPFDLCYSMDFNAYRNFFKSYSKEVKEFDGTKLKYEDMIVEIKYFTNNDINDHFVKRIREKFKKFNPDDYKISIELVSDSIYYEILIINPF